MRRALALAGASVALVATVGTTLGSTASGSTQRKQAKTINIAIFRRRPQTPTGGVAQGARDIAEEEPNVKLTVFDGQFNTNKQLARCAMRWSRTNTRHGTSGRTTVVR